ncbi:hypothetical protein CWC15_14450, partial [Pseudoalteromonas spongiae]
MNKAFSFIFLLLLVIPVTSFAADYESIKRSDLLTKLKAEYQGSDDLAWLDLDALDVITTNEGHLMSIVAGQILTERLAAFENEGCKFRNDGVWARSCIKNLKKLQNSFSEYQKEFLDEVLDKAITDTKKKLLKNSLKDLDKIASTYYDGVEINYGFEWGYGALKTGFDIIETASSDSDAARLEAAWEIVSAYGNFGPAASLASGYVDFLFDFIANYDQALRASWSNMYFGFYMFAKQNGALDTYFIKQGGAYYPRQGTLFYNMMNGLDSSGSSLSYISGPLDIGWDDDEYAWRVKDLIDPYYKRISTSNLDDVIKDGNGLIAFYENKPQINSSDVQQILSHVVSQRNFYLYNNTYLEYMDDVDVKIVSLQLFNQYPLKDVYLIDTTLINERSEQTYDSIYQEEIKDFTLHDLNANSYLKTNVHFSLFGLNLQRAISDFPRKDIMVSFDVEGDYDSWTGDYYAGRDITFKGQIRFNVTATGGHQSISWDFGDGQSITNGSKDETHAYSTKGDKTVSITAIATNGASKSFSKTISLMGDQTKKPIINELFSSSNTFSLGEAVTLNVVATSPDSSELAYAWHKSDDNTCLWNVDETVIGTQISVTVQPTDSGYYCIYVDNIHGISSRAIHIEKLGSSTDIKVQRLNPNVMPARYSIGLWDDAIKGATYHWDFGNGETASQGVSHNITYQQEQSYTISVSATVNGIIENDTQMILPSGDYIEPNDQSGVDNHCGVDDSASYNKIIACYLFNKTFVEIEDSVKGVNYNYNNWGDSPDLYQGTSGHSGLDMQTKNVAGGNASNNLEPFYSVTQGKVIAAENGTTYNRVVVYDSVNDISVIYLHAYQIDVTVGDVIEVGQQLGIQGAQGAHNAWHVHIEVRQGWNTSASWNKDGTLDPIANIIPYLGLDIDNSNRVVESIQVIGPTSVEEELIAQYQLQVNYDDGSSSIEPADTWEVKTYQSTSTINNQGVLAVETVTHEKTIGIWATYGDFTRIYNVVILESSTISKPETDLTLSSATETCGVNGSVTVNVYRPSGVTCTYTDNGQLYSVTVGQLSTHISHNLNINNGTLDTEGETIIVDGDLYLTSGTININKGQLIVRGSLIQAGGTLSVADGSVIVKGDYRIQKPDTANPGKYVHSMGRILMNN